MKFKWIEYVAVGSAVVVGIFTAAWTLAALIVRIYQGSEQAANDARLEVAEAVVEFRLEIESLESADGELWAAHCRLWRVSVQTPCPYEHKVE